MVKNTGAADAGSFAVRLAVDDAQGATSEQTVKGLEAGQEREVRFGDVRLTKGKRTLAATVDLQNAAAEADEGNNDRTVTPACRDDD